MTIEVQVRHEPEHRADRRYERDAAKLCSERSEFSQPLDHDATVAGPGRYGVGTVGYRDRRNQDRHPAAETFARNRVLHSLLDSPPSITNTLPVAKSESGEAR